MTTMDEAERELWERWGALADAKELVMDLRQYGYLPYKPRRRKPRIKPRHRKPGECVECQGPSPRGLCDRCAEALELAFL